MKKVAVVLSIKPQNGGEFQYALTVAQCLKELSGSFFELIAICTDRFWYHWCKKNHIAYIRNQWIPCTVSEMERNLRFPFYSRIYNTYMTELGKVIRKEKIDVLFLTEQLKYVPNLAVKVITPVHDLMHRYEPEFPEVQEGYWEREVRFKCQAKYADYILTDSKLGRKQFRESYLSAHTKKPTIVCLPYIVPEHIWETREEYIRVPKQYVFYPAQFWKHKNHINLVKAIQILRQNIPDIQLVLVGSEKNCYDEIKQYIYDNRLEDNITILGFVNNENVTYLYKHALAMIMPSYFGPTNIPPLEAMALGCPVAVSNKYAMPEQVGDAGLLFNPDSPEEIADCIKRLWTDDRLRAKLIKKGYEKVGQWTKDDFKHRIDAVLKKCLSETTAFTVKDVV